MKISELRNKLERKKGEQLQLTGLVNALSLELRTHKKSLRRHEQAREIVREVGLKTQQQLQYHISDIASLALESIFPDAYKLVLDFVEKRNKTECDILFERDGEYLKPMDASGGGAVDVAAFALRIASWSMAHPRTSNVIVLDEPMRFLSAEYQEAASEMIKEISRKLGIQFIIVTHETILATHADKVFKVGIKNGKSKIS